MTTKHAVITDEMIARARSRIGQVWKPKEPFYNTEATRDSIRHFCHGLGDSNPLYCDEKYAKGTKYRNLVAPPYFLISVHLPFGKGGVLPGIHAWGAGQDWEWFKPILLGDRFTVEDTLSDFVEKPSRMAGRTCITYGDVVYKNQKGEIVAKAKGWTVLAERGASGEKGKYDHIKRATYTAEALKKIYGECEAEIVRGSAPRYWEDVSVADELTPVVKGPLSLRDIICWLMGAGSPYMRAHEIFLAYQRRHPAVGMIDRTTGLIDIPELVHLESTRSGEIGVPLAYDYAQQRISWLAQLLTNWMGDDGFLKKLRAELRLFNMVGDTTWCKGKVIKKYMANGKHLVDIDCWGENQRGEVTMPGSATVVLPSKSE